MKKLTLLFLLSILFSACKSESIKPYMKYSAEFDNSQIEQVESILLGIATDYKLRIFKKNRENMQYLSQGKNAFFTALYFNDDPILIMTNVGVADTLVLTVTDYGEVSQKDLEQITDIVVKTVFRIGIVLKKNK